MNANQKFLIAVILLSAALSGNSFVPAILTAIFNTPEVVRTSPSPPTSSKSTASSFLDYGRLCKPIVTEVMYA